MVIAASVKLLLLIVICSARCFITKFIRASTGVVLSIFDCLVLRFWGFNTDK